MIKKPSKDLALLARLALALKEKNDLSVKLEDRLRAVERAGLVVAGEKGKLGELQTKLQKTLDLLKDLEQAENTGKSKSFLTDLEQLLLGVDWEVAEQILSDLTQKDEDQQKIIRDCQDKIADFESAIRITEKKWEEAKKDRLPVIEEKSELIKLRTLLDRIRRNLVDQGVGALEEVLKQLKEAKDQCKKLIEGIEKKGVDTKDFARQADLLLMKSPEVKGRYEYTVLLRTPSEPGSHGINIQDSSTLVAQDHQTLKSVIDRITGKINAGLSRKSALEQVKPPVPRAELVESDTGVEHDTTRDGRVIDHDHDQNQDLKDVKALTQDIGDLMFRLIMPEPMQRYLKDTPCAITITTNDLELPWELMWSNNNYFCLQRPVARLPMGQAFPRRQGKEAGAITPTGKYRFLLILAARNLPSAENEIELIKKGLEEKWKDIIEFDVLKPEDAKGSTLNDRLRSGKYDVIHYAGHAAFDEDKPDLSGLVLFDGEVFFAQKIRRLLEGRPLVFLNACESGRTRNEQNPMKVTSFLQKPAEGLASAFIYGGAHGCIGALWPIEDAPAANFAVEFYSKVLEGYMIGEAMRQARLKILTDYPDQITWAAFILYGDPTFRLVD